MANGNRTVPGNALQTTFGEGPAVVTAAEVREQLQRILASLPFKGSCRMSRFLRFVVEETLQGRGPQLKEYLIGVRVFDRPDSYDPRTDPVVRSEARRLRSKLLEYYQKEGLKDPVHIHVPKGNYAAVFEISPADTTTQAMQPGTKVSHPDPQSIAVLPFLNLTPGLENECFSDGLTEEIIHALAKVSDMKVVARTSVFQYKQKPYDVRQIGDQLHVQVVLEGSVRRVGERLRITAQLINASDGYSFWSESYDRSMTDLFAMQEEVSCSIVTTLRHRWFGPPRHAPHAYPQGFSLESLSVASSGSQSRC